jgi:hypothetical protein
VNLCLFTCLVYGERHIQRSVWIGAEVGPPEPCGGRARYDAWNAEWHELSCNTSKSPLKVRKESAIDGYDGARDAFGSMNSGMDRSTDRCIYIFVSYYGD